MKFVNTLHSWQGEQQSKTEGIWFKKSCRNTFLVVQRSTLQWNDDVLSGKGIQILEGQSSGGKRTKLLENKTKRPQVKAH